MHFYVRPQPLELASFIGLILSNLGHDLQFSHQLHLLKSNLAHCNLLSLPEENEI